MDLLEHIKSDRAQRKKKQPFRSTLFNRISGMVKEYGLGENFLTKLESPDDFLLEKNTEFARLRKKNSIELPLFSLSAEKEYRLAMAIMSKVNNPYLEFAHSPDEIVLCGPLFDLNPSLEPDKLERYHFGTLLLCERAKEDIKQLTARAENVREKISKDAEQDILGDERSLLDSLENQLEQLQTFISKVEETG